MVLKGENFCNRNVDFSNELNHLLHTNNAVVKFDDPCKNTKLMLTTVSQSVVYELITSKLFQVH